MAFWFFPVYLKVKRFLTEVLCLCNKWLTVCHLSWQTHPVCHANIIIRRSSARFFFPLLLAALSYIRTYSSPSAASMCLNSVSDCDHNSTAIARRRLFSSEKYLATFLWSSQSPARADATVNNYCRVGRSQTYLQNHTGGEQTKSTGCRIKSKVSKTNACTKAITRIDVVSQS